MTATRTFVIRPAGAVPFEPRHALATLALHAIPGIEIVDTAAGSHTRLLKAPAGPVAVTITPAADRIGVAVASPDPAHEAAVTPLIRRWLDLDADLERVNGLLGADPVLAPLIDARRGLRIIGYPDGFEAAAVTVLGQQVSLAACRTFSGRLAAAYGTPGPAGLRVFPTAESVAAADPLELQRAVGITGARARALHAVATACAEGLRIDADGDHGEIRRRLLALPGIGPWTADYLAVRALGDRDAFAPGDLVLRRALGGLSAKEAEAASAAWSPFRAYALFHLWAGAIIA